MAARKNSKARRKAVLKKSVAWRDTGERQAANGRWGREISAAKSRHGAFVAAQQLPPPPLRRAKVSATRVYSTLSQLKGCLGLVGGAKEDVGLRIGASSKLARAHDDLRQAYESLNRIADDLQTILE